MQSSRENVYYFAKTTFRNEGKLFGLYESDFVHTALIGKTGCGKSTTINCFIQNILKYNRMSHRNQQRGFMFIEPHGDLVRLVYEGLSLEEKEKVIYLDLTNPDIELGFNPFADTQTEPSLIVSAILDALREQNDARSWGPKLNHILRACLYCLVECEKDVNFSHILRLLRDASFRRECVSTVKNPEVIEFFEKEFKHYNPKFDFTPIYNKLGGFLIHPIIRMVLVENQSTISLHEILDQGKILLVNVARGKIGYDASKIFGSLMINMMASAGYNRVRLYEHERRPFHIIVDESHMYANSSNVMGILEELRKMKIFMLLSFQHLMQLRPEVRASIFSNVHNLIVYRSSAMDAQMIVAEMHKDHMPFCVGDFVSLPLYHVILKMNIKGKPCSAPFTAITIDYDTEFASVLSERTPLRYTP